MAPSFRKCDLLKLENIITAQNTYLIENCQEIMHKAHNETHLPRVMEKFGPCVHFWAMSGERKNAEQRLYEISTNCNKNLPKSICIRNQLYQCGSILNCDSVETCVTRGPIDNEKVELEFRKLNKNIKGDLSSCKTLRFIKLYGKKLTTGSVIIVEINEHGPIFGRIIKIYEAKQNLYIYTQKFSIICFDTFYHAYQVFELEDKDSNKNLIHIDLLSKKEPCLWVNKPEINTTFVATRYDI